MKLPISMYSTLIFDCDGVVLNSNKVKTEAFRQAGSLYSAQAAEALAAYHVANGGISRYSKFRYFLDKIVPAGQEGPSLDALLSCYSASVRSGLHQCDVAYGIHEFRCAYPQQQWLIVSGGDQTELREIFNARGLDKLFNGGVFGSPDDKQTILERECNRGNIKQPALFIGDSIYDHRASTAAGLDFVFISAWTEVSDWNFYVESNGLKAVSKLKDLLLTS